MDFIDPQASTNVDVDNQRAHLVTPPAVDVVDNSNDYAFSI